MPRSNSSSDVLPSLVEIEAERGRRSLRYFVERAWAIVEPQTPFFPNWHIWAILDHLEAVSRGEIQNLLINIPPRCMKSLSVSVFWPTWTWTHRPHTRWIFSSYAASLAIRDCVKSRRILQSDWYQERWGQQFEITSDQNEKMRYENDKTGYRIAAGVGGSLTGEGGDVLVADDPHNVKEADSDATREGALTWWDEVMSTRLNDPARGAKVIVMQRVHERDLSGHILKQGGYEHLCLPMEYEPKAHVTGIGFRDPRKEDGELLWPAHLPPVVVEDMKVRLGPHGTAGQLQQRPTPRGGALFKREWYEIVPAGPVHASRVRYWDKAGTKDAGKYTAGVLMSLKGGVAYIEDVVRGQWEADAREPIIKQAAQIDQTRFGPVTIWVEQEPGSGGKESAQNTTRNLAGFSVWVDRVSGDKFVRAEPFLAASAARNVKLVAGEWNEAFLREIEKAGPAAQFLDQMDGAAGAYNKLTQTGTGDVPGFGKHNEEFERVSPWAIS